MAGTIVQGNVSTEEQPGPSAATTAEGEKVIEMDEKIRVLKPDDTQFTTLTSKLTSRTTSREKCNWIEEEDFPRIISGDAQTSGSTTINAGAGQGKIVMANDLLRNMRTGEGIRVVSVAVDALTVARGVGNVAAAATNAGDTYLVVADAQPQGSDFPTPRYLQRIIGYNFTQITRTPWSFTGTDTAVEKYGGREPAKEAKRAARVHKKKWEAIGFFGMRSFTAAVAPENEPRGTAGGAVEFISTFKQDVNGPLTPTYFDTFCMNVFQYGTEDKVLFASPLAVLNMSQWNRSGMGSQWDPSPREVHGVKVDAFISGAYGYRIPVIVKKEWGEFPNTLSTPSQPKAYGSYAMLLDLNYIERRPLRDRDTKLVTDQQPKGKDVASAEYITEATYEFAHERAHGILFGITSPP